MRVRLFVLLLALAANAEARTVLLVHVPLQWKPTSSLQLGTRQMSEATVQFEPFVDVRENRDAIGQNLEDDVPKPVTTPDDVGAFVGGHIRELFNEAGVRTVDTDGAVLIRGEVKQFFVRETTTYKSEVVVHLRVIDRNGVTLWNGDASGEATRFGRSYKLENYDEVLSDAVVNTVSSILQSAELQKALSGQ